MTPVFAQMSREELARAAEPLSRIVSRDVGALGYEPTDAEIATAQGRYDELNKDNPQRVGALGPQAKGLGAKDVARLVKVHQEEAQAAIAEAEALTRGEPPA